MGLSQALEHFREHEASATRNTVSFRLVIASTIPPIFSAGSVFAELGAFIVFKGRSNVEVKLRCAMEMTILSLESHLLVLEE